MVNYAQTETKCAGLDSDFGRDFLFRRFDAELAQHILNSFGTYTRGPRKGKQRGYICWTKTVKGGWVKDGPGYYGEGSCGHVASPGTSDVRVSLVWGGEGSVALYADIVCPLKDAREQWKARCWEGIEQIIEAGKIAQQRR